MKKLIAREWKKPWLRDDAPIKIDSHWLIFDDGSEQRVKAEHFNDRNVDWRNIAPWQD